MNEPIKVDIWSDVACPWCYIGKRKLEAAIQEFSAEGTQTSVVVEYHSFLLNPDMPVDYEGSQTDYLVAESFRLASPTSRTPLPMQPARANWASM